MGVTRGKGLNGLGRGRSEDNNHSEQERRASHVREEEEIDNFQPTVLLFPPWPVGERAVLVLPYSLYILLTSFFLREEEFHKYSKHRAITKPHLIRGWSF